MHRRDGRRQRERQQQRREHNWTDIANDQAWQPPASFVLPLHVSSVSPARIARIVHVLTSTGSRIAGKFCGERSGCDDYGELRPAITPQIAYAGQTR